jgi:hypothetical protein
MENSRGGEPETKDEHDPDDREQEKRAGKLCARETHKGIVKSRESLKAVNRES